VSGRHAGAVRRILRVSGLVLALIAAASVAATPTLHAQDAQSIVGRSSKVYRSLASLSADFVQIIDNPMIDSAESRGTLIQAGPSKLSMRFTDPPGEAVVIDGKHVWVYTPSTVPGQVLRLAAPSGGPVYGYNLLAWFLDRPAERYTAKYLRQEKVGNRAMEVVELTPAVPDLPFDRAVLWLDREDALPRRLEITEKSGAQRTLILSKLRLNRSIPDATFTFTVPDGARVVDQ
jgi:outer membrane lipoprotein carrier protein